MIVKVYLGPRFFFEEKIKHEIQENNSLTLNEYLKIIDEKRLTLGTNDETSEIIDKKIKKNLEFLVCHSDDFYSLSDSGINNFISIINENEIKNIFIHNPPSSIREKLEQLNVISEEVQFEYKEINLEIVEKFAESFSQTIIGQENARKKLIRAIFKKTKQNKPLVIMLYGPSGVGKTETAKFLANLLDQKLFRKQFSMFQTTTYGDYLFGASHNKNSFAKDLLDRESNIILLDEFDKTGTYFHSAFYQLFDEGIYEDKNYIVNLKDTIILCTSNYRNLAELKNVVGEPLFYRFDYIIEFTEISDENKLKIIEISLEKSLDKLTSEDKKLIKFDEHKENLQKFVKKIKNVREINRLIDDLFLEDIIKNKIKNY